MTTTPTRRRSAAIGLTTTAAVATALATLAMWPVFINRDWLRASLVAIVVAAVVGAAGRVLGVPRIAVMALQLAALAMLITAWFVPDHAILGVIPTAETWHDFTALANRGATAINQQTVPVLDVPGIALLVTIGVGVAAIEVDFVAVAMRNPAVAGFVLLAVYLVPVVVLPGGASWLLFAVAAAGWLLLLYVARREAVHAWGDVVGPMHDPLDPTPPRAVFGAWIALVAVGSAVLLAGAMPGVGEGVVGRVGPRVGGNGTNTDTAAVKLDLSATLERNLRSSDNIPLLTYTNDERSPQYLRLTVLDTFDDLAWRPADIPLNGPVASSGIQPLPGVSPDFGEIEDLVTTVTSSGRTRDLGYLPAPYTAIKVDAVTDNWQWDQATSTVFSRSERFDDLTYRVTSRSLTPRPDALATASSSLVGDVNRVVPDVPAVLRATAVNAVAGATSNYQRAVRLQAYFRDNFTYDLSAPLTNDASAIEDFLAVKRGYCQQFAATYALMARALGMPSRVVVGFTPGTEDESGRYTVRSHDFHAWPEVWFDGAGWVRFEPTPNGNLDSRIDVPSWSVSGLGGEAPRTTPSASASANPSQSAAARPNKQPLGSGPVSTTDPLWQQVMRTVGTIGLVVLVLFLAVGPGLARVIRRRRRLSTPRGPSGVEAAWSELGDTALDLGLSWSNTDTPQRTADTLVRDADLDGRTATAVQQLRREVEQVRYAPQPMVTGAPAATVREVREQLMGASSARARWRARLYPVTVLRRRP